MLPRWHPLCQRLPALLVLVNCSTLLLWTLFHCCVSLNSHLVSRSFSHTSISQYTLVRCTTKAKSHLFALSPTAQASHQFALRCRVASSETTVHVDTPGQNLSDVRHVVIVVQYQLVIVGVGLSLLTLRLRLGLVCLPTDCRIRGSRREAHSADAWTAALDAKMDMRACMCIIRHVTCANPTHCSRLSDRRSLSSRFRSLSFFLLPAAALFLRARSCPSHQARMRMARSLR